MDQETTDKFYKPKESELIMGYECEIHAPKYKGQKFIVDEDQMQYACIAIRGGFLYTPYLTKEDIQAEGWELENYHLFIMDSGDEKKDQTYWKLKKGSVHLMFYEQSHEIRLYKIDFSRETTRESGFKDDFRVTFKCPSINEFRYICKLLEI